MSARAESARRQQYEAMFLLLRSLAPQVTMLPLRSWLEDAENFDSFAPYTDPTAWMNNRERLQRERRVIRAFATLQTELTAIALDTGEITAGQAERVGRLPEPETEAGSTPYGAPPPPPPCEGTPKPSND